MFNYYVYLAILLASGSVYSAQASVCIGKIDISPCWCSNETTVICDSKSLTDLTLEAVFSKFDQALNSLEFAESHGLHEVTLDTVYINSTSIVQLRPKLFANLRFKRVIIENAYNLRHIHPNTFTGTALDIQVLAIRNTPLHEGPRNDLFVALNTLKHAREIYLTNTSIYVIPSNAFVSLVNLEKLYIDDGLVRTIKSMAFRDLPMLNYLRLAGNRITRVGKQAFDLKSSAQLKYGLTINLDHNLLTDQSFNGNPLSVAQITMSPIMLQLEHNHMTVLNESIYYPLLTTNTRNSFGVEINCDLCDNYWLISEELNGFQTGNIHCRSGAYTLGDSTHFTGC